MADLRGDVVGECFAVHRQEFRRLAAVEGDDAVGEVVGERQECQRAAVEEAFARGMVVGKFVFEAEDEDVAPEFVRVGGDAHRAADEGEATVGRDQQFAADGVAVIERYLRAAGVALARDHAATGVPAQVFLPLHRFVGGTADDVVRHEVAEGVNRLSVAVLCRHREMQAEG